MTELNHMNQLPRSLTVNASIVAMLRNKFRCSPVVRNASDDMLLRAYATMHALYGQHWVKFPELVKRS